MLRDEARGAHRKNQIRHQHRHRVAGIAPTAEPDREVYVGGAKIKQARVGDQLQLDTRILRVKKRQSRNQPARGHGRQHGDGKPLGVVLPIEIGDGACNMSNGLIHSLRQALTDASQFEATRQAIE